MISLTVFDWFKNEPLPPEWYAPMPIPETTSDSIAIGARGISAEDRLRKSNSIAVLCRAPNLTQKHVLDALEQHKLKFRDYPTEFAYRCLLVAAYSPPLSVAARMRLVRESGRHDVLCCIRSDVPYIITPYTMIHRKTMRWRYRKLKAFVKAPHDETDRVYMAAMTKALKPWQRREILGNVKNESAREYFELKTGVKIL